MDEHEEIGASVAGEIARDDFADVVVPLASAEVEIDLVEHKMHEALPRLPGSGAGREKLNEMTSPVERDDHRLSIPAQVGGHRLIVGAVLQIGIVAVHQLQPGARTGTRRGPKFFAAHDEKVRLLFGTEHHRHRLQRFARRAFEAAGDAVHAGRVLLHDLKKRRAHFVENQLRFSVALDVDEGRRGQLVVGLTRVELIHHRHVGVAGNESDGTGISRRGHDDLGAFVAIDVHDRDALAREIGELRTDGRRLLQRFARTLRGAGKNHRRFAGNHQQQIRTTVAVQIAGQHPGRFAFQRPDRPRGGCPFCTISGSERFKPPRAFFLHEDRSLSIH